jgi:hypothetical protein
MSIGTVGKGPAHRVTAVPLTDKPSEATSSVAGGEVTVENIPAVKDDGSEGKSQNMGGSMMKWATTQTVVASIMDSRSPVARRQDGGGAFLALASPARRPWDLIQGRGAAVIQVLFSSLGKSSGEAFTMTILHSGAAPFEVISSGFVLEPVRGMSQAEAGRALAKLPGTRATATLTAYCLDMPKQAPRAGMIYRIAPSNVQQRYPSFPHVMEASAVLRARDELHPDGDPEAYFHAIRQWSIWTAEERLRDEAAFTRAFLEHARRNVTSSGRRWTRELEQSVREVLPNRWSDIQSVLSLAGVLTR